MKGDTTFELADDLWLTDTTHTNESLIGIMNFQDLVFGISKKTRAAFRFFAGELVIANPKLLGIKTIGRDLDKAQGMSRNEGYIRFSFKQTDAMQLENICSAGDK